MYLDEEEEEVEVTLSIYDLKTYLRSHVSLYTTAPLHVCLLF